MKLYFIRHGESEANVLKEFSNRGVKHGLTTKGKTQTKKLLRDLKAETIHKIYCSPLLRAIETAQMISDDKNVPYEIEYALKEFDCGVLEGRSDEASWDLFFSLLDDWLLYEKWEKSIPGGESFFDIKNRFLPFIENITNQFGQTDQNIAIVGHGGTYMCALPLILGNIDLKFALDNLLKNVSFVKAEMVENQLICRKWGVMNFEEN